MYLVKDPRLVIVDSVVLDGVPRQVPVESIDDLDLVEGDDHASTRPTRDVLDQIGLDIRLHIVNLGDEAIHEVEAWIRGPWQDGATPEVNTDVTLVNTVHTGGNEQNEHPNDAQTQLC